MKKLTLGLCLVTSSAALAHDIEYKVCKGDTLQSISAKFHVSGKAILHVNDLQPDHHMRPGHYLLVPFVKEKVSARIKHSGKTSVKVAVHSSFRSYVVRNGDQDWALAKKCGISLHSLHAANPGIDWDHLKLGSTLRLPVTTSVQTHERVASNTSKLSHLKLAAAHAAGIHMAAHWHQVEDGENDWIIAHKAGIRLPLLKALNSNLDLANLHAGEKIRVPGASVARMALQVKRIHSSHVAINGDNVTIRTDPGVDAESICTVDQGIHASVVDRNGSWYQLKFPKGTVGWVRGDLLKPVREVEAVAQVEHHRHEAPHREAPHHETYVAHHESHPQHISHPTVVATRSHHAAHVEHSSSISYTAMDTAAADPGEAQSVLHVAHKMRGTRYIWGSASRSGTDCSGFALQVYAKNGIHLPRTSSEQAGVGVHVDRKDLKPGDLVFFHTMRGRRISHVVIYEGNGKFIHASSSGGHVQENSLNESYYNNRFVTARRILKHHGSKRVEREAVSKVEKKNSDPAPVAEAKAEPSTDSSAPVTAR